MEIKEVFEDIEHPGHLSEYEHFRSLQIQRLEKLCQSLKLAAIILDQVLVWEEENVGEFERLVDISMGHQLLVCKSLVCLFFLKFRVDLRWAE